MTKSLKGNALAISAVVFAATYTIFNKLLLNSFSPMTLAFISQTFSVIALLALFGAMPEWKKLHKRPTKEIIALIILSLLATVVAPLLFLKGLELTTATNAILIGRLDTIFLAVISAIWLREKITEHQIVGTIIMLFGIGIIVTEGSVAGLTLQTGDLLILLAALSWAFSTSIFKKFLHHIPPEAIVIVSNGLGALLLFFVVPYIFGARHDFQSIIEPGVFKTLLAYSIFTIVLAQFFRFKALDLIEAHLVSSFSLTGPIFALIFAVFILGEAFLFHHMVGGAFVVVGLIFSVFHHQSHPHHHHHEKLKHHGQH